MNTRWTFRTQGWGGPAYLVTARLAPSLRYRASYEVAA